MNTSAAQAKKTIIYVVNYHENKVEKTTLLDWVFKSAERTTSPRGIMNILFYDEVMGSLYIKEGGNSSEAITNEEYDLLDSDEQGTTYLYYIGAPIKYAVKKWVGSEAMLLATFKTEEAAQDEVFNTIYNIDFMQDDQRDINYFSTEKEAEEELARLIAEDKEESQD